ncbi:MAG: carboxypeptidase-like regulatory domain-containing protein [Candidatus Tectimicrobiota bacterium]
MPPLLPLLALWFFALWWIGMALRDSMVPTSPRYRASWAVPLALVAAGQYLCIGVLVYLEHAFPALLVLGTSAITLACWQWLDTTTKRGEAAPGALAPYGVGVVWLLHSHGLLVGTVCTPHGRGIAGAKVTVHGAPPLGTHVVYTHATGLYLVVNLPPGRYTITAQASGFTPGTITDVALTCGQVEQRNLTLTRLLPEC